MPTKTEIKVKGFLRVLTPSKRIRLPGDIVDTGFLGPLEVTEMSDKYGWFTAAISDKPDDVIQHRRELEEYYYPS